MLVKDLIKTLKNLDENMEMNEDSLRIILGLYKPIVLDMRTGKAMLHVVKISGE